MGELLAAVATKIASEWGIVAAIAVVLVTGMMIMFFFVIRWILNQQVRILDMADKQNEKWQNVLDKHTEQAALFHTTVLQAQTYQRDEHKEHKEILIEINRAATTLIAKI